MMSYNNYPHNNRDGIPRDPNRPGEETKQQAESDLTRYLRTEQLHRQLVSMSVPTHLPGTSNILPTQLPPGSTSITGTSSFRLPPPAGSPAYMQQALLGQHSSRLLLGGLTNQVPSTGWNPFQAEALLLQQRTRDPLFLQGAASIGRLSSPMATSGMTQSVERNTMFGGGPIIEGRVQANNLKIHNPSEAKTPPDVKATPKEVEEREEEKGKEPHQDDDDSIASDNEVDALDDEAFYKKRDSVDTVEDLHLQQESFPQKLYRMLYELEKNGNADIVSFLPNGRAFKIFKMTEFASVLSKYFQTNRMASFQRQLNLYGFHRITEGKDKGAFFHEKFQKGKRSLCKQIKRTKKKRADKKLGSQQGSTGSTTWGRSVAAGQRNRGPAAQPIMNLGSSNMSGAPNLGMALESGIFPPLPSASALLPQQQLNLMQLHWEQEVAQQMLRDRIRREEQQRGPGAP